MIKGSRDESIDICKGFLIIGVVWGHTIAALRANEDISIWILTFFRTYDMPFFMFLSGYLLSCSMVKMDSYKVLINRLGTILLPLVVWQSIVNIIKGYFSLSLWFVWSVFVCQVLIILLSWLVNNRRIWLIIMLLFICIGLHLIGRNLLNLGYMLPFFSIGYFFQPFIENHHSHINKTLSVFCMLVFIVLQCFYVGEYNVWNAGTYVLADVRRMLPIILIRGTIGLTGIVTMYNFFCRFGGAIGDAEKKFIIQLGQNTFLIYVIQHLLIERFLTQSILSLKMRLGYNPFTINPELMGYFISPIIALCTISLMNKVIRIIKSNKYTSLLFVGKKIYT